MNDKLPYRQIRATYSESTIRVYQAYSPAIGLPALKAGVFVPPFNVERMTWIKPSFLWMAYRCGWGTKRDQECVLAIDILRQGFEWALANASLSHFEPGTYRDEDHWSAVRDASPVRVQWDPERDLQHRRLAHRSIQVGLSGVAVHRYVDEWIAEITDVSGLMRDLHRIVGEGRCEAAAALLPRERPYQLAEKLRERVGAR